MKTQQLTLLLSVAFVVGCGGGGGGGTTYNYTVTSTNFFTGGQQVAVVRIGISGTCSAPTDFADPKRVGAGTVDTPGTVSFSFTTGITPPILETVYIDNNASGNLDFGDRVWGDNPNNLVGICWDSLDTDQSFDWEDVAEQIRLGLGNFQSSIIYTGASQAFRGEPGSEPELKIDNIITVDGNGYNSIKW